MASEKKFTVAIVGGGFVGLVCAVELARQGIRVDVFEAAVRALTLLHLDTTLTTLSSRVMETSARGSESVCAPSKRVLD